MPKSSAFPNGIPIENFARILYEYGGSLIFQRLRDVFNHILVKFCFLTKPSFLVSKIRFDENRNIP